MARFRQALRPINRIKHVVDNTGTLAANAQANFVIASTKDAPVLANISEVETGSKINGFYIRFEVASNNALLDGAIPNFYLDIFKNPGGNLTNPNPSSIGDNDNKRYVIHQEMTMIENKGKGSNARTVLNAVVIIPKGYRRNGPGDLWTINTICPALATVQCLQVHYKEFR